MSIVGSSVGFEQSRGKSVPKSRRNDKATLRDLEPTIDDLRSAIDDYLERNLGIPRGAILSSASFKKMDVDSTDVADLLAYLEQRYEVGSLSSDEINACLTITDMAKVFVAKCSSKTSGIVQAVNETADRPN